VQIFDFSGLIARFDALQSQDESEDLFRWSLGDALPDFLSSAGGSAVIGGELAYQYATTGGTDAASTADLSSILSGLVSNGTSGDDKLSGLPGFNDTLDGGDGNDVLEGMDGNDQLTSGSGNNYLNGGAGEDSLAGGDGGEFYAGGAGDDAIQTGGGEDVIGFNRGDGNDSLVTAGSAGKTLSLGGGIGYADLALEKQSDDLVVVVGASESITLKDWYGAPGNRSVLNLQVVAEAMASFDAGSSDPLSNTKVQDFDFSALVRAYDEARAADENLTRWGMMNTLLEARLAASDTEALGGDLAFQYGLNGTLAGIGLGAAQDVLSSAQFGIQAQTLGPLESLQQGAVRLS
jgi:Ca2+-binding RTX toxin-like protein